MVAPTVYRSDDASAPALTGEVGKLIALLDACLVTGYGAKAAAGWSKTFTGTNLAAYRMGTGGAARQMYMRVDDTGTTYARVRGFDAMTDVNTGTEPFPTVAQQADPGLWMQKSITANTTVRPWVLIATPTFFYLMTDANVTALGTTGQTHGGTLFFGEYPTYVASFVHNVALIANSNGSSGLGATLASLPHPDGQTAQVGHFACRNYTGAVGAVQLSKLTHMPLRMSTGSPNVLGRTGSGLMKPDPITGKVYASRVRLLGPASNWALLGHLPGMWAPGCENFFGEPLSIFNGSGALAGRSLLVLHPQGNGTTGSNSNTTGCALFDLTNAD